MRLFVSYARPDRLRVDSLVTRLRQAGIEIWLDSDLVGGQLWWDKILGALRSCDAVLVALSRASINSQTCSAEREYAAWLGKPILPITLEPVAAGLFPPDIARIQIIDYSQPDEAAAFQLVGAIFALPEPRPLPNPMPPPPPVPRSRLAGLGDRIGAPSLALEEQLAIVGLLEEALDPASDPDDRQTAAEWLDEMAQRQDLYAAAARKIEILRSQVGKPPGTDGSGSARMQPATGYPSAVLESSEAGAMTPSTSASSSRIFVSYRREDAAWPANSLVMELVERLGADPVFRDVDSIQPGDDFDEAITAAVASCAVLLAVIGDTWLAITDQQGQRRLDNPQDFVRLEIETALTRNIRVIPILVGAAPMPRSDQLPAKLERLARKQALQLRPDHFKSDIDPLLRMLDKALTEASTRPPSQQPHNRGPSGEARAWPGKPGERPLTGAGLTLYAPNPLTGPPGTAVTVPGTGLGSAWDSRLTLNGSPIPVTNWSANGIQFTVPVNDPATNAPWNRLPRAVRLAVMVMDQPSDSVDFMITS